MLGHGFDSRRLHTSMRQTPHRHADMKRFIRQSTGCFFCRCADFLVCLTDWVDCRVFGSPSWSNDHTNKTKKREAATPTRQPLLFSALQFIYSCLPIENGWFPLLAAKLLLYPMKSSTGCCFRLLHGGSGIRRSRLSYLPSLY